MLPLKIGTLYSSIGPTFLSIRGASTLFTTTLFTTTLTPWLWKHITRSEASTTLSTLAITNWTTAGGLGV